MQPAIFDPRPVEQYELLDSGAREKLERFGSVLLRRPEPQALWRPRLAPDEWKSADLVFVRESDRGGRWESPRGADAGASAREWTVAHGGARFLIRPTPFKHVGLFPEQATNWAAIEALRAELDADRPRLLNLFGYTGAASVLAARAGWDVTHVDASKASITWAVDNAEASGLGRAALRVVCEDALRFARREVRRESRYDAILLDPPHYGRGPKGEVWRLEEHLADLVEVAAQLAADRALVILSTYAVGYSPLAFTNLFEQVGEGSVVAGELAILESDRPGLASRTLPAGFCARWARGCAHDR
ncbi:MAG: SAM-dependent methyltransferase [Planctomycetota bacterium]